MKRQKAFIGFLLCVLILINLCACGSEKQYVLPEEKPNIICTLFPAYDFVCEIAGERANVILLMPPGAESHSYEPTPQDMAALIQCDLIVANGGVDENWLEKLISTGDIHVPVVRMLDCVTLYEEEVREGMQTTAHAHTHETDEDIHAHETDDTPEPDHEHDHTREHDHAHNCELHHCEEQECDHLHETEYEHEHENEHEHGTDHDHEHSHQTEYDEHVWTSPANAARICQVICAALCQADAQGKEEYLSRTAAYTEKLLDLDARFHSLVDAAEHNTMIFADRFPVRYFVEEYGLEYYAAFPGCAEDAEPSAKTVAFLIDKVREEQIGAVYYIEFSNQKMADVISEDTGCRKLLFHSCHNVSAEELANGISYLQLMEQNYLSLKEGLADGHTDM